MSERPVLLYRPKGFTPSGTIIARASEYANRYQADIQIKISGAGLFSCVQPNQTPDRLADQVATIEAMRPAETYNPDSCIIVYCGKGTSSRERVQLALGLTRRSKMAVVIRGLRRGRPFEVVVTRRSELQRKAAELSRVRS